MGISFKRQSPKYDKATQDRIRCKIADANVANRLLRCFMGEIELRSDQVAIGLALLKKVVPDLQSQEIAVTETQPFALLPSVLEDAKTWSTTFKPSVINGLAKDKGETEH